MDIEGPDKPAPRHATRVKMLWDERALYVGAWMDEPQPWAHLTLHDDVIYQDNDFEIFIDPDGDNHMYYEFEVNALGTWWDLFLVRPYRDGGPALHSFESVAPSEPTVATGPTGWEPVQRAVWVDGAVNDGEVVSRGWGVEVALPWSLLRQAAQRDSPPKPGDQWRINFSRVQWRVRWDAAARVYVKHPPAQSEANWVWSPQWAVAMHQPEYWGYVQFSDVRTDSAAASCASAAAATSSPTGADFASAAGPEVAGVGAGGQAFTPDPTWPLRSLLMEVYYAQKRLWDAEQRYADSLSELGLPEPEPHVALAARVQSTEVSFVASAQLPAEAEAAQAVHEPSGAQAAGAGSSGDAAASSEMVTRMYVNEEGRITTRKVKATPSHGTAAQR